MADSKEPPPYQLSQKEVVVAGASAGLASRFVTQPLDVIKIKFQLQVEPISSTSTNAKYRSFLQTMRLIVKEEGIRALWSGHNSGQLLSITYGAANFTCFEWLCKMGQQHLQVERDTKTIFVCGTVSGLFATTVSYPFDVLRTRFIAQGAKNTSPHSYRSIFNGLEKMWRSEGRTSPYKGLLPALMQSAPLIGTGFAMQNFVKTHLKSYSMWSGDSSTLNLWGYILAGGLAGFVSKTIIYPLDLARKRLQFQGFQKARIGYGENFTCAGLSDCFKTTVAKEGLRGLFKGYFPSVIKATVSTSAYFTIYELVCDGIRFYNKNS